MVSTLCISTYNGKSIDIFTFTVKFSTKKAKGGQRFCLKFPVFILFLHPELMFYSVLKLGGPIRYFLFLWSYCSGGHVREKEEVEEEKEREEKEDGCVSSCEVVFLRVPAIDSRC